MVLQNNKTVHLEIPGLKLTPTPYDSRTAKFDLMMVAKENDGTIDFTIEYSVKLFTEDSIKRFAELFKTLSANLPRYLNKPLPDVPFLSPEEKQQILIEFNDTATEYPRSRTIHELFEEQAEKRPDAVAAVYDNSHLTYGRLNIESNHLAARLRKEGARPDTIIGMVVDRSLEMLTGIFGILKAGAAYLPLDPDFPEERKSFMMADCCSEILLTSGTYYEKYTDSHIKNPSTSLKTVINLDSREFLSQTTPESTTAVHSNSQNLSYVIYTSGTTGKPKGTLTMHYNVTRVVLETNYIAIDFHDRLLQLSNYAFDGSVFDIYGALLNGSALVLMKKEHVPDPLKVSQLIQNQSISIFFITTALFNALVDFAVDCFRYVKRVIFGGEKVSFERAEKAFDYMGPDRLLHAYGPTETTVFASMYNIKRLDEVHGTIPIGSPISNTTLYILDNYFNPQPIGITGEIFVGGEGVARGYLNRPELTAESFVGLEPQITQISQIIYKTGDLGRWNPYGNIQFMGRVDHQVKIRGFRIELEGIASHLLSHPLVREALVLVKESENQEKYLCAYFTAEVELTVNELENHLAAELPAYMVPSIFLQLGKMPLTATGKLDRKSLPEPGLDVSRYTAPRNHIETTLVTIWSQVLKTPENKIGIDDDFFRLGGHSLLATVMTTRIHKALDVKLPLAQLFRTPTIRELSRYIRSARKDTFTALQKTENREHYPLSPAQKRLYILYSVNPQSTGYNVPLSVVLEGSLDRDKLENSFKQLIRRHESLRTSVRMINDSPVQTVHDNVSFEVQWETGNSKPDIPFIQPFDLSKAPLLRVGLKQETETRHILMVDMHHIITDGTSMEILINQMVFPLRRTGTPASQVQIQGLFAVAEQ